MSGVRIEVREVTHRFQSPVLGPLSFQIEPGEFVTLLGPSGCGKSTLLRLMAGLTPLQTGVLTVTPLSRGGFVFQDATLLPWRTVLANVALPRELSGEPQPSRTAAARKILAQVGLSSAENLYPRELSGGMRMRVSIARALSVQPSVLFLDEPFASLDETARHDLQMQLRALRETFGCTVVFVTHSLSEAVFLSDRVLVFSARPARLINDHRISLPRDRDDETRTSAGFTSEIRQLREEMRS